MSFDSILQIKYRWVLVSSCYTSTTPPGTLKRSWKQRAENSLCIDAKYFTFGTEFDERRLTQIDRYWKSQLEGLVTVSLFDFSSARKTYLEKKGGSFVKGKMLYCMDLKQSFQCFRKYPE
jgi:hypothetical protein